MSGNPIINYWKSLNCYPPEYNRAIHGPYDPRINYAFKDTPLMQVKLGELPSWIMRRKMTPHSMAAAITRHFHRTNAAHFTAIRSRSNMAFTVILITAIMGYVGQLHHIHHHRRYKYHW
ncbi:putative ATP synthase subunit f, mitochondrial [Panonychus citri]|uniref:putative ATP synthase subunit f, mitochondrial n=1 Tax=Panonychus citri TaxID=50023 RepID=UPI0023075666|nr:putative ATP synthase subunit f, mitochondrial [Panonychus citri]